MHLQRKKLHLFLIILLTSSCLEEYESDIHNVFGSDERITYSFDQWPWTTYGRLDSGCTAVALDRTMALTAAHCVWDSQAQKVKESATQFHFQFGSSNRQLVIPIETIWIGSKQPEQNRSGDWAILRLQREIPSSVPFLSIQSEDISWSLPQPVQIVGYMEDCQSGSQLCGQSRCELLKVGEEGRVLNNCDSVTGVSGAPVLADSGNTKAIIGLAISEYRKGAAQSLKLETYSDEYANVSIPSANFASIAEQIRKFVAEGQSIPLFENVFIIQIGTQTLNISPPNGYTKERWLSEVYYHSTILISVLEDFKVMAGYFELPTLWDVSNRSQRDLAIMSKKSGYANRNQQFSILYSSMQFDYEDLKSNDQEFLDVLANYRYLLNYSEISGYYAEYSLNVRNIKSLFDRTYARDTQL